MTSPEVQLTWYENLWAAMYKEHNHMVVTTFFGFTIHFIVYYARFLPFLIADYIPALQKYKIQQDKENTPELFWKCLKTLLFSQFCIQLPMQLLFHPVAEYFGMKIVDVPFPKWQTMAYQVALFMIFEDLHHYVFHRLLHYGPFYKYIHKQHHEFQAPFGITAEYAHPIETLILGTGTIGGPLLYVYLTKDLHLATVILWLIVRLIQTVDAHSGYDFPWSLHNFVPFWAGADFHDHHHMVFLGNYGSSFRVWDWLFGTDKRYNMWKLKQKQMSKDVSSVKEQQAYLVKEE